MSLPQIEDAWERRAIFAICIKIRHVATLLLGTLNAAIIRLGGVHLIAPGSPPPPRGSYECRKKGVGREQFFASRRLARNRESCIAIRYQSIAVVAAAFAFIECARPHLRHHNRQKPFPAAIQGWSVVNEQPGDRKFNATIAEITG